MLRLITFEGPEGAGKTTQAQCLLERLRASGREVLLLREPGATSLGERLRELLLPQPGLSATTGGSPSAPSAPESNATSIEHAPVTPMAAAFLYSAARAQMVEEVIEPRLSQGAMVVCDRYADSTLAYQGYGEGLDLGWLRGLVALSTRGLTPDLTFLLDLPPAMGLGRKWDGRATDPSRGWNLYEERPLDFHERVRQGYLALAAEDSARWLVLDATKPVPVLAERIWQEVSRRLS